MCAVMISAVSTDTLEGVNAISFATYVIRAVFAAVHHDRITVGTLATVICSRSAVILNEI